MFSNPTNRLVQISGMNEISDLNVIGIDGKALMKQKIRPGEILDISSLPAGTYILSISNEQEVFHQTVMKM
jgi:ribosomal protein L2